MANIHIIQKKKKLIDLPEDTLRVLSIQAAALGTSLKEYLERVLIDKAKDSCEDLILSALSSIAEASEWVSDEEKADFETQLKDAI